MAFFESRSSIGRKLAVVRWFLPLVLALLVVIYETLEHVVYVPEPIGADFVMEVGFFGFVGPVLVALGITWLMRNLGAQEQAQAEIRRLNASLEQQVTERTLSLQQAYQELEEKNRELRTLDQLKSEFVSLVSHELRAPLTNINGGIELLLSGPGLSPHCRDTLRILGEQSQRLTQLVETILSISAIEARRWPLTPGPVAVPPLVQAAIREMIPCLGRRQIRWQGVDDLPFAWADEVSMAQVLTNLLDNAIKYSPDESEITIDAQATADTIRITVADEGPGIPPEARERVFDRFHRLDVKDNRRVYGHGLGLYMARLLVEAQEGQIWVEAHAEQGARFVVSLPQVPEEIP
ncbi:MAG TPA: ATP-binding protein [Anaerolineae bacterium]|nr:ATP-binding protein [Anaerolineae bacterium]